MRGFWKDLAFGVRTHLATPVATATVILTLAIAIAANSVTFSLVNGIFLRPLPVHEPERLVRIYSSYASGLQYFTVSYPDYADMRELGDVFSGVLVEEPVPVTLGGSGDYERVWGELVSGGYFSMLGLRPVRGRFFAPEEEATAGGPPVAVLSHGLWQRRFGGSPGVLGQTLVLNGHPFKIIGIVPRTFQGTSVGLRPDVWLPATRTQGLGKGDEMNSRRSRGYFTMARLKPGVGIEKARAALDVLARQLQQSYPNSNEGIRFTMLPESDGRVHPMARGGLLGFSRVLIGVTALVLLLACTNVAGALLVRAASRRREIGVRLALGAARTRIVRQFLTESACLALVAGGIGLALAWVVTNALSALHLPIGRGASLTFDFGLDARVLAFSLLVTVLTAILFGLTPALDASRLDLVGLLKGGESPGRRQSWLRYALVGGQVAVSMVLLIAGGLFLRSLQNAHRVDLGFDPKGVVMTSVDLGPRGYTPDESKEYWRRLVDRVAALPRTQSVTLADRVPFELNITTMSVAPEGYQAPADGGWPSIDFATVGPGYFTTMRIPLIEGGPVRNRDDETAPPIAVVNDVLARQFWPGTTAVGKRFVSREGQAHEVVGVAGRTKHLTLGEPPKPYIYFPRAQSDARAMTVVARGHGDPLSFLHEVRETVRAIDDTVPLYNMKTMSEHVRLALLPATAGATALNVVGLVALVLTSLGLYGTVAYAVGRRTYEIGVRRALGAQSGHVIWLVVRQAVLLVGLGVAGGLLVGLAASSLLKRLLYGVDPADPLVLGLSSAVLLLVCLAASWAPTWRATRIEAASALRCE